MSEIHPYARSSTANDIRRIALCITELDPGGAEKALFEIVTRLDRTQWLPKVFCLGPETELSQRLIQQGIETVCLGATRPTQVSVLFQLVRELKRFRPGVLQSFLFHANIVGRLAAWMAGVPCVYSGLRVAEKQKRWHLWLDRWTQWFVSMNVCVSEGVRQYALQSGLSAQKLCVIPNGVDVDRFANALPADLTRFGIPAGSPVVITVGRLTHQKGHDLLLHAIAPLVKNSSWHLLIVGEGEQRSQLEEIVRQLQIESRVHLPGWQSDVPEILAACQVFVLPSRWEGMPNALLESMASGLVCIATDVEGVRELLGGKNQSQIVLPNDLDSLEKTLNKLQAGEDAKHSKTAYLPVLSEHTWNAISHRYSLLWSTGGATTRAADL